MIGSHVYKSQTMTKPTPDQIQRACDLVNAKPGASHWTTTDYGRAAHITALGDTIAQLDAKDAMIDTLTAERDKARADLGEIDRLALDAGWGDGSLSAGANISRIAAAYRVETDPLVEALRGKVADPKQFAESLRADPRWLEIGRSA